jgi:pimeloyl-ACP methyl ester carboxylesterase
MQPDPQRELVGHSLGALVAVECAARHPARVEAHCG